METTTIPPRPQPEITFTQEAFTNRRVQLDIFHYPDGEFASASLWISGDRTHDGQYVPVPLRAYGSTIETARLNAVKIAAIMGATYVEFVAETKPLEAK